MSGTKKLGLLNKIGGFLAYKPPQQDTFVLPETHNEKNLKGTPKNSDKTNHRQSGSKDAFKPKDKISTDINTSLGVIKKELNIPPNVDAVIRRFKLAGRIDACIVFMNGMADHKVINDFILRQLMNPFQFEDYKGGSMPQYVSDNVLPVSQAKNIKNYGDAVKQILIGDTILFINSCDSCLAIDSQGFEKRNIEKPATEAVVRGPQEGFTESTKTSISQIRRIIKNKELIHETINISETNHCSASILYIKGIANPAVVKEVKRRLQSINTDFIMGDGMLEQFIEENPWMFIPQVLTTERPDRAAAHLMEGKVTIFCEGAPFAIIVPVTLLSLIHSPEDSYLRWQYGTALRLIRLLALFVALLLPGLYIALINYHQEMLPTDLLIAIARAREAVPFPTIIEVLLMEVSFELIREAGIRVPGLIGTTLGIIGALILGQAAVAANIVSPIMIIIVAVTGLGSFAIPNYSLSFGIRMLRFFFILMGSMLGFFGISVGLIIMSALATGMKSFGVPFLAPGWPKTKRSPDLLIRYPVWEQEERPDHINTLNKRRQPRISRGWVKEPPPGKRE